MKRRLLLVFVAGVIATGCAKRDAGGSTPVATAEPPPVAVAEPAPGVDPPAAEPVDAGTSTTEAAATDCDAEAAKQLIGQVYTHELGEQARASAGARVVRALRPGEITTMEFLSDRLTLTLDESGRISSVNCG